VRQAQRNEYALGSHTTPAIMQTTSTRVWWAMAVAAARLRERSSTRQPVLRDSVD
jgi:hypothetical protein